MALAVTPFGAARATLCVFSCAAVPMLALALGPAAPFAPPTARVQSADRPAGAASTATPATPVALDTSDAPAAPAAVSAAERGAEGLSGLRLAGPRSAALIDGQWWPLGAMPRGARLVAVQRQLVQLRHPDGRIEVLALNPAVATGRASNPPDQPAPAPVTR